MRYIGSKTNLLTRIDRFLTGHLDGDEKSFLDLFSGTNAVGLYFKPRFSITSNDLLYFSFLHALATVENNRPLNFSSLRNRGISDPLKHLQGLIWSTNVDEPGYYEMAYSPTGGAMYLTTENARHLDLIRNEVSYWAQEGLINRIENAYLVSSLIRALPSVSNTTGTYGAFLKKWDRRALKPLTLEPLPVLNNGQRNRSFNQDANVLASETRADIIYIDTPYNNRQYAPNYHLLENVARNEHPELKGATRIFDWSDLKSDYSSARSAENAFSDLISTLNGRHVVISYSSEGIIPEEKLTDIVRERSYDGQVTIERIPYRKYKSKVSPKSDDLYELLIHARLEESSSRESTKIIVTQNAPLQNERAATWEPKSPGFIKSPVNYVGGKYRLLPQLIPLFPADIETFVDLFAGGANVGINVAANTHVFNDMNHRVIDLFRYFQNADFEEVDSQISQIIDKYRLSKTNEQGFLTLRTDYNLDPTPLGLYVLAAYSYNYQFRFNSRLEFNNPFGRNRSSYSPRMRSNLKRFMEKLHSMNAQFAANYFDELDLSYLTPADFVYMDPPYLITVGSYNDGHRGFKNWSSDEEAKMYELMHDLTIRDVPFALSNVLSHKGRGHTQLAEEIARRNYYVTHLAASYGNSSYNTPKLESDEVVVTNYPPHFS